MARGHHESAMLISHSIIWQAPVKRIGGLDTPFVSPDCGRSSLSQIMFD